MLIVFLTRVACHFGGRQGEDQPAVPRVNRMKTENVFEERAIRVGIFTVDD